MDNLNLAAAACEQVGVDAILVGPGADLVHLVGYHAMPLERLTLLVVRRDGEAALVVPSLELARAKEAPLPDELRIVDVGETDNAFAAAASCLDGLDPTGNQLVLGAGDRLWAMHLIGLQDAVGHVRDGARWTVASKVTRELRMVKSADELEGLRRAGQAVDRTHARVPDLLAVGRTEAEIAADIDDALRAEGHEEVNFIIVASGPNGASPHHETGARRIADGDVVLVDIGGTVGGWCSDCTRNYVVGEPSARVREAWDALEAAQQAAVDAVRPGVTCHDVDSAARTVLELAGFGEAFIHRTGHGIGLEEHEEPWIVAGNDLPLRPGMTFSIEPGVYLEGEFGLRIEDIVAVTEDGAERFNTLERGVVTV